MGEWEVGGWLVGCHRISLNIHSSWNVSFIVTTLKLAGGVGGGGGGFILACGDFWRLFDHSFPICAAFFFFLEWGGSGD